MLDNTDFICNEHNSSIEFLNVENKKNPFLCRTCLH